MPQENCTCFNNINIFLWIHIYSYRSMSSLKKKNILKINEGRKFRTPWDSITNIDFISSYQITYRVEYIEKFVVLYFTIYNSPLKSYKHIMIYVMRSYAWIVVVLRNSKLSHFSWWCLNWIWFLQKQEGKACLLYKWRNSFKGNLSELPWACLIFIFIALLHFILFSCKEEWKYMHRQ